MMGGTGRHTGSAGSDSEDVPGTSRDILMLRAGTRLDIRVRRNYGACP